MKEKEYIIIGNIANFKAIIFHLQEILFFDDEQEKERKEFLKWIYQVDDFYRDLIKTETNEK